MSTTRHGRPKFHRIGELVAAGFEERVKQGKRLTLQDAADRLGVSIASVVSWKSGGRLPSRENADKIARVLFTKGSNLRSEFQAEIRAGHEENVPEPLQDPMDLIVSGRKKLDVAIIPSGILASPDQKERGFLSDLFDRYARHAAIGTETRSVSWEEAIGLLKATQIGGVLTAIVATVDRLPFARFHPTPVLVPINAVIHRSNSQHREKTKDALVDPRGLRSLVRLRPLVSRGEIGFLYVTRTLELAVEKTIDKGDLRSFAEQLAAIESGEKPVVPVMVADEFTCGEVVLEMKRNADLLFRPYDRGPTGKIPADPNPFPTYLVSYATNRRHERWTKFLEESFELFLESDAVGIAKTYFELWRILKATLRNIITLLEPDGGTEQQATQWADRLLRLDQDGADARYERYHAWKEILKRARDLKDRG